MKRRSPLAALVVAALAAASPRAVAEPARVGLEVALPAADLDGTPRAAALARGIADAVAATWPTLLEVRPGDRGDATARVAISRAGGALVVTTEMAPAEGTRRTIRSTVPAGSDDAVVPVAAADIAWLWAATTGFRGLEPGPAPGLAAVLETDALAGLTGWSTDALEPLAVASSPEGVTILFPRGWLTLEPLFRLGAAAARDLALAAGDGLPYAGVARSARGTIVLARADGTIEAVDPLFGARTALAGPAGARLLALAGHEAALAAGSTVTFVPLDGAAGPRAVTFAAAWITAVDDDAAGLLWAWDGQERRIRIADADGREVGSVRPLVPAASLASPQALAVLADGSFLVGGTGQLWKFERSGVPTWRISRLPGVPGGTLPAAFAVATDGATGAVWILDGPSRRVMQFGGAGRGAGPGTVATASLALAGLLESLDERDAAGLELAAGRALEADQPFAAARLASRLARLGAPGATDLADAAETAVLRDHALAAAADVDALAGALLAARAADACQRAVDLARAWRDRDPGDPGAGRLLERLTGLRRELRDAATAKPDAPALAAEAAATTEDGRRVVRVRLILRAPADAAVAGLRVAFGIPGWTPVPASADAGDLAAGEQRAIDLDLALADAPASLPSRLTGAAWLRWTSGAEGRTVGATVEVRIVDPQGAAR